MRARIKRIPVVAGVIVIALSLAYCAYAYLDRRSAIKATLEWGRLAPFPDSAEDLVVTPEGNMFTRSFRVSFSAPAGDIARWVGESPGLRGTLPEDEGASKKYVVKPGGGASYAEVLIDGSSNKVRVYVARS